MKAFIRALSLAAIVLTGSNCSRDTAAEPNGIAITPGVSASSAPPSSPLPSASLSVCKVAGDGIGAGQVFTFNATLLGATRSLAVSAGSCATLSVPRESSPLEKGTYKSRPDLVAGLLAGTAKLALDGAQLSATDVQAVLQPAANVQASSSLLLNLAQQLIAADLNVLRGVQPSAQVLQALLQANAQIQIALSQGQIDITTTLTPSQLSALVDVLTAFNEGKTKPPASPASADLELTEVLSTNTQVGAITCQPTTRCSGVDLVNGRVTATVTSGETTIATYTNLGRPVLRVCKVAGPGIAAGTVFHFTTDPVSRIDPKGFDVLAGGCGEIILTEENYYVFETGSPSVAVSAITCDPAARCLGRLGPTGAVVAVVKGTTTATFTNRSTMGTVRVCKVAGADVPAGTVFHFTAERLDAIGPTAFDAAAGACSDIGLREGDYYVGENTHPGFAVASITCEPAARCATSGFQSQRVVTVVANEMTTVTFTNQSTLGTLRVCKVAGLGVAPGTVFHFNMNRLVTGAPTTGFDVAAGSCVDAAVEQGDYFLVEPITAPGYAVGALSCEPTTRCSNIAIQPSAGRVTVAVVIGATTTVTFTNRSTLGTLRVCKVAGSGVTAGTVFHFVTNLLGGPTTSFDVAAGACADVVVQEGNHFLAEPHIEPGYAVSAISCVPVTQCTLITIQPTGAGLVELAIAAGSMTTVTFTNVASP